MKNNSKLQKYTNVKDARSVSFYPYNQSQTLQFVKYTKKNEHCKTNCKIVCQKCVLDNNKTTHQLQNKLDVFEKNACLPRARC